MKVVNGSRDRALAFRADAGMGLLSRPYVVIGLIDPDQSPPLLEPDSWRRDAVYLRCMDLDNERIAEQFPQLRPHLFTREHAERIATFVKTLSKDIEGIFVHCEAGVSRSAGVAAALDEYFQNDASRWFQRLRPNPLVYHRMQDALSRKEHDLTRFPCAVCSRWVRWLAALGFRRLALWVGER